MRRGVLFGVSVAIHLLAWGAGASLVRVEPGLARHEDALLDVVLVPRERGAADTTTGKPRDGVEPTRPTGAPDPVARGIAGDHGLERAEGPHRRAAEARDRMTTRDDAAALAEALGALARAADAIRTRGGPSTAEPLGARDDAQSGARPGDTLVAPGARGLDMLGTGRGSGPHGDELGTVGRGAPGPGALSAAEPRAHAWWHPRPRHRDLCVVVHPGCPVRRSRFVVSVEWITGPVDLAIARRAIGRYRAELARCLDGHDALDVALAVAPDGAVLAADTCVAAALRDARLPVASVPSRLRLILARALR